MSAFARVSDLPVTLRTATDIHDLIGAAYEQDGLLLHESDLAPEFFDLKTGLLGELFQKLTTYRKSTAFVLPDFAAHGERFAELASEHARHSQIRFFTSEAEALVWLSVVTAQN